MTSPILETKSLFISLLKKLRCDLVLDIGSRDGKQSILFRDTLPQARIVAFEANPFNYRKMAADPVLTSKKVTLSPCAVSNVNGQATFHIADANYQSEDTEHNNLGISSLLVHPGVKSSKSVDVTTVRLDTLLNQPEYAGCRTVALWIDVESAEYWVLEGLGKADDRVQFLHVETAKVPMRVGQKTYEELSQLLNDFGFVEIGNNLESDAVWGDVIFIRRQTLHQKSGQVRTALLVSRISRAININRLAVALKRVPWLYRTLRYLFVRVA